MSSTAAIPDLWKLHCKVRQEDQLGAIPLLLRRRDLLLSNCEMIFAKILFSGDIRSESCIY